VSIAILIEIFQDGKIFDIFNKLKLLICEYSKGMQSAYIFLSNLKRQESCGQLPKVKEGAFLVCPKVDQRHS
jgi:hypothetical protein